MTSIESIESAQAFVKAMLSLERRTDTDFRFIAQCIKNTVCASPHRRYFYILDIILYSICSTTQRKKHSKHYADTRSCISDTHHSPRPGISASAPIIPIVLSIDAKKRSVSDCSSSGENRCEGMTASIGKTRST